MKKIISFLVFCVLITSVSCKKKDNNSGTTALEQFAKETKIFPLRVMGNEASLSFVENSGQKDISSKLQIKKSNETVWKNLDTTNQNNILATNLSPKTTYHLRVELKKGTELRYSAIDSFTTRNFYIDYARFFSGPANTHDAANGIFSIEGAKHIIYGGGFSNESAIKISFAAPDNATDIFSLDATIINDSMISFDIPRDHISNNPYLHHKLYSCMIGDLPLIGYKSYLEKNYLVKGDMRIVNRDLHISSYIADGFSCKTFNFYGSFGIHETETVCPKVLYGIAMRLKERKLIISDLSGTVLKEYYLTPTGSSICDDNGLTIADEIALSQTMIYYHEVSSVTVRSSLPSGSYKAQIREIAKDESVVYSNEITISF
jgi:hypothetical protein